MRSSLWVVGIVCLAYAWISEALPVGNLAPPSSVHASFVSPNQQLHHRPAPPSVPLVARALYIDVWPHYDLYALEQQIAPRSKKPTLNKGVVRSSNTERGGRKNRARPRYT